MQENGARRRGRARASGEAFFPSCPHVCLLSSASLSVFGAFRFRVSLFCTTTTPPRPLCLYPLFLSTSVYCSARHFSSCPQDQVEWWLEHLYSTEPWKFEFIPSLVSWNIFGWVHRALGAEKSQPQPKFLKKLRSEWRGRKGQRDSDKMSLCRWQNTYTFKFKHCSVCLWLTQMNL